MKVIISLVMTLILVFMLGVSVGSNIGIEIGCNNGIYETFKFQYNFSQTVDENYSALKNKCVNE